MTSGDECWSSSSHDAFQVNLHPTKFMDFARLAASNHGEPISSLSVDWQDISVNTRGVKGMSVSEEGGG